MLKVQRSNCRGYYLSGRLSVIKHFLGKYFSVADIKVVIYIHKYLNYPTYVPWVSIVHPLTFVECYPLNMSFWIYISFLLSSILFLILLSNLVEVDPSKIYHFVELTFALLEFIFSLSSSMRRSLINEKMISPWRELRVIKNVDVWLVEFY